MITGPWSAEDEFIVRQLYAETSNEELAEIVGRAPRNVGQFARKLGLKKSERFLAAHGGRFQKGAEPFNKGVKRGKGWAPGRMAEGQFRVGRKPQEARNYVPIGSLRVTKDGYLERKVTDDTSVYPARRWVAVHREVWEAANGPVPAGHIAVFKPGRKTTDAALITADAVEVITRSENLRRNSVHRYPKELAELIQLRGALNRQINKRARA